MNSSVNLIFRLLLLHITVLAYAQNYQIETKADTLKVKLGAPITLTLKTKVDTTAHVVFPETNFFGSIEVIENHPIDTLLFNEKYELTKKYGITQWDSGKYSLPRLQVLINGQNYYSDSLTIEIESVKVDTLQQALYDIKPIDTSEPKTINYWWLILVLGILIAGLLLYKWWQKKRSENAEPTEHRVVLTPIEKASMNLEHLERRKLVEKGEIKEYYTELTQIIRVYIEETIQIPALESTSNELLEDLKSELFRRKIPLTDASFNALANVLTQSDLVKFAKSTPEQASIIKDQSTIKTTIEQIEKSLPKAVETDENLAELEHQKLIESKKRKDRILLTKMVLGVVLVGIFAYFGTSKLVSFIQNGTFKTHNKELLEQQWVESQYGYPPILIQTPEALMRSETKDQFTFGTLSDPYSIVVAFHPIQKDASEIEVGQLMETLLQEKEKEGWNIQLAKRENLNNPGGFESERTFGNAVIEIEPKQLKKVRYDLLVIKTNEHWYALEMIFDEDDPFGNDITERIISSIKLGTTN